MEGFDKQQVLAELGGIPEDVYDEIGKDFLRIAQGQVAEMRTGLQDGAFEKMAITVHTLKGSSGNLRLKGIRELAIKIETLVKARQGAEVPALLDMLDKELEAVRPIFNC